LANLSGSSLIINQEDDLTGPASMVYTTHSQKFKKNLTKKIVPRAGLFNFEGKISIAFCRELMLYFYGQAFGRFNHT
jgi:hypothetical protein